MAWWVFGVLGLVLAASVLVGIILVVVFTALGRKRGQRPIPRRLCSGCGQPLATDSLEGLCPRCLLKLGIDKTSDAAIRAAQPSPPPGQAGTGPYRGAFTAGDLANLATHFPQLQILEFLGQGGMGAVYKARQPGLDRLVALKILPPASGRDPAFAERFTREARALAKLGHPNIVMVHDFGRAGELYYFVMEYVDGVNLRQMLRSEKLQPEQALQIIPQICDALQFAHEEGVVHRDIKPENILLDKKGRVKIADFGLAKLLGHSTIDFQLTGPQQIMGTPHYMAPEQMEKPQLVDHRADIYSLGVVFYEMLTGQLPLGRFEPPSQKAAVDVRLDQVVGRAMEREPDRRYQRASEVKTDVETIRGIPQAASTPFRPFTSSPSDHGVRTIRQRIQAPANGLLIAGLFAVLSGIGLILWSGWGLARLGSAPQEQQSIKQGMFDLKVTYRTNPSFSPTFLWSLLASQVLAVGIGSVMLMAGVAMKRLNSHQVASIGSVLAMVPVTASWFVSLPMGLWAFLTLRRPEVRSAFDSRIESADEDSQPLNHWWEARLATISGWAMVVSLLGALTTFLPWARVDMFGIATTSAGFDSWQGIATGCTFFSSFLLSLFLELKKPMPRLRSLVSILAGAAVTAVATILLWDMLRPAPAPKMEMTGDVQVLGGLLKPMMEQMFQGLQVTPLFGIYVTIGLGVCLFVLGLVQLLKIRAAAGLKKGEVHLAGT